MNIHDATETAYKNGYKQGMKDAVEVVHSSWGEGRFNTNGEYEEQCLNCKMFSIAYGSEYCPNCGAKMDGERRTDG